MVKKILIAIVAIALIGGGVFAFNKYSNSKLKPIEKEQKKYAAELSDVLDSNQSYEDAIEGLKNSSSKDDKKIIETINDRCNLIVDSQLKIDKERKKFQKEHPKATDFSINTKSDYYEALKKYFKDESGEVEAWLWKDKQSIEYGFSDKITDGGYDCYWYILDNNKLVRIVQGKCYPDKDHFEDITYISVD